MNDIVRVGIVDDHAVVARGLGAELTVDAVGIDVVSVARTVPVLLDDLDARGQTVDVVVLDLQLHDGSTPDENVKAIVRAGSRVLVFSAHAEGELVLSAVLAGASGYLNKDREIVDLVQAIRDVAAGDEAITGEMLRALATAAHERPQLSPQQEAVLVRYTSTDSKLPTIARQLGIKPETLKTHLRRIKDKYAAAGRPAHTRLELYRRAVEDGFVVR